MAPWAILGWLFPAWGSHGLLNPLKWSHRSKLIAAFATLYVVWGSTYLAIRIGLEGAMPPALFAGARLAPAGAIMLAFAMWRGSEIRMPRRELVTTAIVGIFLLCGGMYFTFLAEQYIASGLSALIVAVIPLWVASAEWLMPDMETPTPRGVAGLVIGFVGLGMLVVPRLTGLTGSSDEWRGIGLQVFATLLWATGSIISKRNPVKADSIVVTGYEMLIAGGVLLVVGVLLGEANMVSGITPAGYASLLYLMIMGSCVAFTAFVWALKNAPASKVMTYTYVNPVIAVFLGWAASRIGVLVRPEPVDAWLVAGMVIIIAGVALTTTAPSRKQPAAETVPS